MNAVKILKGRLRCIANRTEKRSLLGLWVLSDKQPCAAWVYMNYVSSRYEMSAGFVSLASIRKKYFKCLLSYLSYELIARPALVCSFVSPICCTQFMVS